MQVKYYVREVIQDNWVVTRRDAEEFFHAYDYYEQAVEDIEDWYKGNSVPTKVNYVIEKVYSQ